MTIFICAMAASGGSADTQDIVNVLLFRIASTLCLFPGVVGIPYLSTLNDSIIPYVHY